MIYVENTNEYSQRIYIPKDEADATSGVTGHTVALQVKDYVITENGTTRIHPDGGYDGISGGTIGVYVSAATGVTFQHLDVTEDGLYIPTGDNVYTGVTVSVYDGAYQDGYQAGYSDGYDNGYNSGYSSGQTDGYAEGRTDGYSEGYTKGSNDGYQEGYRVGYAAGYSVGRTDGMTAQKELLAEGTFTQNGTYTREDGWSAVTVQVEGEYQDGYQDGIDYQKSLLGTYNFTANTGPDAITFENGISAATVNIPLETITVTANTNGSYDYLGLDHFYSDVHFLVDVPQSGRTPVLTSCTITQNGTYIPPAGVDGFSSVVAIFDATAAFNSGYTSGMTDGYSSGYTEGVDWRDAQDIRGVFAANGTYHRSNGYGWNEVVVRVDTSAAYTSGYTDGTNYQQSLLGSTAFTENGTYTNQNGWSAVTVQAGGITGATKINLDSFSKNIPNYGTYYFVFDEHTDLNTIMLTFGNTADTSVVCTYDITTVGENRIITNTSSAAWMKVNGQIVPPEETWTFGSTGLKTIPWGCKGRTSYMYTPLFVGIDTLVSVVIGSGVTNVESGSFMDCQNLTAVTFETGSRLRGIAGMSFQNCVNLSSITFPSTLEYIEYTAFHSCRRLSEITCLATTAPELRDGSVFGQLVPENGTLRVPTGSDYSTWLAQLPSGWTIQYI